jgi:hypothetical protein
VKPNLVAYLLHDKQFGSFKSDLKASLALVSIKREY